MEALNILTGLMPNLATLLCKRLTITALEKQHTHGEMNLLSAPTAQPMLGYPI